MDLWNRKGDPLQRLLFFSGITAVTSKQPGFPLLLTLVLLPFPVCARAVADYL